jgi:hypothetical protein
MLPIIAALPAPLDFTLGFSLIAPALGALAFCCLALAYSAARHVRNSTAPTAPKLWSAGPTAYACDAPH